jgi:DNA modification methylase
MANDKPTTIGEDHPNRGTSRKRHSRRSISSINDLIPDSRNANRGTPRGRALLADSLTTYGTGRSILVDRDGRIIAGNKTAEQAKTLALPVRVVETDGDHLVVVQRTDLDLTADPAARQLALADNRIAELDLSWDPQLLAAHQAEGLDLRQLWTDDELEQLAGHGLKTGQAPDDAVVPLRETTITRGDLFELGAHRVLCGDATDATDVTTVLGTEVPPLMVTDPPYGVSYDAAWRVRAGQRGRHAVGQVLNDDRADWSAAFTHFPGPVAYVWHAGLQSTIAAGALLRCGFVLRAQIIWAKPHFVLGRGDFHWGHEPCWYAVRDGHPSNWRGGRTQSTVWSIPNLNPFGGQRDGENAVTGHSTQKPVALYEKAILFHTQPEDAVFDPFLGSGTAVIACEKTTRRCLAIELEPRYVQAAIDRWETFTGKTARPVDGRSTS